MDMSLEVLEKFATEQGNEELINAVNSIKESLSLSVSKLSTYEKDLKKAIEKRDATKTLVKTKLGVDDLTEDALDTFLSQIKANPDERVLNENKSLAEMLSNIKKDKETIESKYNDTVQNYQLEKTLSSLGAAQDTENQRAYDIVLSEVRRNAKFDDSGNIIFESNDGSIIRNKDGSPATLSDVYNQIKESEEFAFLFKRDRNKGGSGAGGAKGGGAKELAWFDKSSPEFSLTKQAELFRENPALYNKLKGN